MSNIIDVTKATYDHVFHDLVDHRSDDWYLMASPLPTLVILALYSIFVKIGPLYMKDRPAYRLNKIIALYNFLQICYCGYIIVTGIDLYFKSKYRVFCEPVNYSNDATAVKIAETCWLFYILKIVDLLDTVFFILRKNFDKASTFHVWHHGALIVNSWITTRFFPGGHGMLPGFLTVFIRLWLYCYYLLSMIWPNLISTKWWGRHYNLLLVMASVIVTVHNIPVFFIECVYPRAYCAVNLTMAVAFMYNFYKFYRQAWSKQKST